MIFDETLIRPKLDSASINPTATSDSEVALRYSTFCFSYIPWIDDFETSSTFASPNVLQDSQLQQADTQALPLTQQVATPNHTSPPPASLNLILFNSDTHEDNQSILSDSEDELNPPPPSSRESPAPQSQQRSARLEKKPMHDYYKINRGRTYNGKTNSSIPPGSPHSQATQMLYDYAFSQSNRQVSGGFVRIAPKRKVAKPDLLTLKQIMIGGEADEWKKRKQVEYDTLILNGIWKLIGRPFNQYVVTSKWAFKRKSDMSGNIKRYKSCCVA